MARRTTKLSAVVETGSGALEGRGVAGTWQFLGVPFAAALVGEKRFDLPSAPEPWSDLRSASEVGPPAPQSVPGFPLSSKWFGMAGIPPANDCLHLNVTTPSCDRRRRPVLVFLHGGGFVFGSGASPLYNPAEWVLREDVVVVTLNYRLGVLGFGDLGARFPDLPANRGLRDQCAALHWVAREIEAFGGDPDNVTLFGESAGAMSIAALLASPEARPLFRRAILQSGAAHHISSSDRARSLAEVWYQNLGAPGRLQFDALSTEALLEAQRNLAGRGFEAGRLPWQPVVDGDWLEGSPLHLLTEGALADKDILIGTNADEWKLFALGDRRGRRMDPGAWRRRLGAVIDVGEESASLAEEADRLYGRDAEPLDAWCSFQRDRVFVAPALALADAQAKGGGRAFVYRFDWKMPWAGRRLGAFHGLELPFVFGNLGKGPLAGLGLLPTARRLSRRMGRIWANFARTGNPEDSWPQHEVGSPLLFAFSNHPSVERRVDSEAMRYQALLAAQLEAHEERGSGVR